MSRVLRMTKVGVRVSKLPTVRSSRLEISDSIVNAEPSVIDKASHKRFVDNVFAMRGRTTSISQ